jgi:hypothetical protein
MALDYRFAWSLRHRGQTARRCRFCHRPRLSYLSSRARVAYRDCNISLHRPCAVRKPNGVALFLPCGAAHRQRRTGHTRTQLNTALGAMDKMHQEITERLSKRFEAYCDLAAILDVNLLNQKVDVPKHKSLTEHLWCVVGARESYAQAIVQGEWAGFACSMEGLTPSNFQAKLDDSAAAFNEAIRSVNEWTSQRTAFLVTLAEHEVMHEGQIIRHMYALERELPESWVWA